MGILKKVKSVAKSAPVKRGVQVVKGVIAARSAVKAIQKGNVGKADAKGSSALKNLLGKEGYSSLVKGEKKLIGEKNAKALDRVKRTAVSAGSAGYSFSKGDFRGAKDNLGDAITTGVGKNNLRVAQHAGQDAIGKNNYNAIHKYGKRSLNVGLDVMSAASAIERGDYFAAAKYGGNAVRTGIGAEKLHEGKRALRDKIGQKNYDLLNNSYKAAQLGHDIGKTAADFSNAKDEQKYMKMAAKAKKLHDQATKAHELFKDIHAQAKAHNVPVGHASIVSAEPVQGRPNVQTTLTPIGGKSTRPR
jgi:hypothetical protein